MRRLSSSSVTARLTAVPGTIAAVVLAAALLCGCTPLPSVHPSSGSASTTTGNGALSTIPATSDPRLVPAASSSRSPRTVKRRPTGGAVLETVQIPSQDGFQPRAAYVYLPPSAVFHPDRHLPVLELLHGTPGQPVDWINGGDFVRTLDNFASKHHGEAPIVVVPDLNGAHRADSECIRTADGKNTERYLTVDVVNWVRSHFARTVGLSKWWLAGLSEGGVCSVMLALRHPYLYSAFGDFSGLAAPLVDHLTQAQSDRQLYGLDAKNKRAHEPLWLLGHRRYPGMPAWFECGASDHKVLVAQAKVVAAARTAQLEVHATTAPGKHGWTVWSAALRSTLPWLWRLR